MNVFVNNSPCTTGSDLSLERLLSERELLEQKGIAVAVNNQIIPRQQWKSHHLNENDRITIITATQGG